MTGEQVSDIGNNHLLHLYNTNESMTLEMSLELEFGSKFIISDTEERLAQFRT